MIKKAVIPAAGLGTRLLPVTKELPKEMLPIVDMQREGELSLKPMLQAVFEQLYNEGIREFAFIIGRGKRAIEDHFSPDSNFTNFLMKKNKHSQADYLMAFYEKINNSTIIFINQPKPNGFGDAVSRAKIFTQNNPFLIHAGDDLILSKDNDHMKRIANSFEEYDADAIFFVEEVVDPRKYGVIAGHEITQNVFRVTNVIEKPRKPPTNLAIVAIYVFKPCIYSAIERVKLDESGEIQLTDAIKVLINEGNKVYALKLNHKEKRIDIGTAESYLDTLQTMRLLRKSSRWGEINDFG